MLPKKRLMPDSVEADVSTPPSKKCKTAATETPKQNTSLITEEDGPENALSEQVLPNQPAGKTEPENTTLCSITTSPLNAAAEPKAVAAGNTAVSASIGDEGTMSELCYACLIGEDFRRLIKKKTLYLGRAHNFSKEVQDNFFSLTSTKKNISRVHMRIEWMSPKKGPSGWYITVFSKNGVWVDGQYFSPTADPKIKGYQAKQPFRMEVEFQGKRRQVATRRLYSHSKIVVGDVAFFFVTPEYFKDPGPKPKVDENLKRTAETPTSTPQPKALSLPKNNEQLQKKDQESISSNPTPDRPEPQAQACVPAKHELSPQNKTAALECKESNFSQPKPEESPEEIGLKSHLAGAASDASEAANSVTGENETNSVTGNSPKEVASAIEQNRDTTEIQVSTLSECGTTTLPSSNFQAKEVISSDTNPSPSSSNMLGEPDNQVVTEVPIIKKHIEQKVEPSLSVRASSDVKSQQTYSVAAKQVAGNAHPSKLITETKSGTLDKFLVPASATQQKGKM